MDNVNEPSLANEIRDLKSRLAAAERIPRYVPTVIPSVITGTVNDFGFAGRDSTSFGDVFRADVFATAPIFEFEIQTGTAWGSGITTVDWQIEVTDYNTGVSYIVAESADVSDFIVTDNGGGYFQIYGQIDLFEAMSGEETLNRFVRIDVEIKRNGGSGEAALRLIRPMLLRVLEL